MTQQSNQEQPVQASNERAVAWARQMMARKRAEQKRMVEEYKTNPKHKHWWQTYFDVINNKRLMLGYDFDAVKGKDNAFYFTTDFELAYEVLFEPSGYIFIEYPDLDSDTFELIIKLVVNVTGRRTPPDPRTAPTIADIFRFFLTRNERVVVYICDSSDRRQVARARKFDGWYEQYRGIDFIKIDRNILDPSGEIYLTSLIMRYDNPNKVRVFEAFDRLTSGENSEKP